MSSETLPHSSPLLMEVKGITKSFGHTNALNGVDFKLHQGEVLCLIGENGAGKSTLMKILSGTILADSGVISLNGSDFKPENPHHSRCSGISMVYQELSLAPHLTVSENLFLGIEPSKLGIIDKKTVEEKTLGILREIGLDESLKSTPVHHLSPAQKQMVEIARALLSAPQILVLDEPTSSLGENEIKKLFHLIHKIRKQSISVIYISHFLEECLEIGDRYLVLRDGSSVAEGVISKTNTQDLIRLMVGRNVNEVYPRVVHKHGKAIIHIEKIAGISKPQSVSFDLLEGEILGIAGLIGTGRTETLRLLFGLDYLKEGVIEYSGRRIPHPTPQDQVERGFGFLSENRKEEGLMLNASIEENTMLSSWKRFARHGLINFKKAEKVASEKVSVLKTKHPGINQCISTLSGGNQQKVAIARLLAQNAQVYLLDEPTRGIDINSKVEIYRLIGQLAAEGKSIIIVSSYLPELFGICDTLCVMNRGRLGIKKTIAEWTPHSIIHEALA